MSDDASSKRPPRRRRRRKRGDKPTDAPADRGARSQDTRRDGDENAPRKRRRRRRGGRPAGEDAAPRPRDAAPTAAAADPVVDTTPAPHGPPTRAAAPTPATAEVDAGWDEGPDVPGAVDDPTAEQPWGDDRDAPTPDVALPPALPADPSDDDPDPASAVFDDVVDATLDAATPLDQRRVREVVGVKFSTAGRIHECDAGDARYPVGTRVVVEAERGQRVGTVAVAAIRAPHTRGKLRRVLRAANESDGLIVEHNARRAREALDLARDVARQKRLAVKLFRAELSFGGTKCTVYYSSEDRVDLRDVQSALARRLDCRVELRQVGVRDAAKAIGGIGSCGRELCCSTFLPSFAPVSIKMAKDQNIVLNPAKVSGQCGRLKCCLVYEQHTYAAMRKGLPKMGKRVITDDGEGRVVEVDVLRQRIRVSLGHGDVRVYAADQVQRKFPPQTQSKDKPPATDG